ncbi:MULTISPECIES: hypothetical protein [unclassified Pseudescherichia]|uniref:hypothetical protein n=1 Tax=Pseudescherichia TaxID=2055880 RepID=UPI00214FC787|nr:MULTISPECIES: hypothetical protein [unclassified Pseudescherichia]MCR4457274.1 hypothetical protein [Pseudescherichia sp. L3]
MNKIPDNSIIVTDITSKIIEVIISGDASVEKVKEMGFVCHTDSFSVQILDEEDKINKIKKLISANALFSFGYGWYPSEVIAYYKDRGVDFGIYKVIRWAGKDEYKIEDVE